jgi:thiol:disulfide interchange protein
VFVDVTADWCITCLANEKAVLSQERVRAAFQDHGVTYMVADWTDYDPIIADFVAAHGRSGIPLYVLYSGRAGEAPQLLPQLLRARSVIAALQQVSPEPPAVASNR